MQPTKDYKTLLHKGNLRNTKRRNLILEVVEENKSPMPVEAIFIRLKERGVPINISTVYRALEALVASGLVTKTTLSDSNKALYEMSSLEHKHHLLCVKCRQLFVINDCPLGDYEKALEERTGFSVKGHRLELYGYCLSCKEN